jgi:hypothetical protein
MALRLGVARYNKAALHPPDHPPFWAGWRQLRSPPENDLRLPDPARWVPGLHATLRFCGGSCDVVDVSTNGQRT